jgi:hypothetical protein
MLTAPPAQEGAGRVWQGMRRYFAVAAVLGVVCVVVVCVAVAQSAPGGRAVAALQEMLCCEGCCMATASVGAALADREALEPSQSGSPTVLQASGGGTEIDYTAGGHRVSQHMESALSELDHLEDRVKNGRPKFLTESAAQREADLMSDKFAHKDDGADLAGKARQQLAERPAARNQMVDPYAKEEQKQLAQAAKEASKQQAAARLKARQQQLAAEKVAAEKKLSVVEATEIANSVSRQNHNDIKALDAPMHTFSKGLRQAESDAARAFSSIDPDRATKPKPGSPGNQLAAQHSKDVFEPITTAKNVFEPITTAGLGHELSAKGAGHDGQSAATTNTDADDSKEDDAQEEAILRKLAQRDIDYTKSTHAEHVNALRLRAEGLTATAPPHKRTRDVFKSIDTDGKGATSVGAAGGGAEPRKGHKADGKAAVRDGAAAAQGDKSRESAKAHVTEAQDGVKKAQDGDKQRLNGVLDRINNLISKQTGGASRHPTYFKHFDDTAEAKAQLAALRAHAKLAAAHLTAAAKLAQRSMQLKAQSPAARVRGTGADSQLRPVATAGGRGGTAEGAQASLVAGKGAGDGVGRRSAELHTVRGGGGGSASADRGSERRGETQLRQVRGGMGRKGTGGTRLAGSGVALQEERMLYGSHHDLDTKGTIALKESSLLGLGL